MADFKSHLKLRTDYQTDEGIRFERRWAYLNFG